jgi:hypothetical protein
MDKVDKVDKKDIITAKLAEWGLQLTDSELDQLVVPYENLIRWQGTVEDMLRSRKIADGMQFPESEPIFIHALDKKGGVK